MSEFEEDWVDYLSNKGLEAEVVILATARFLTTEQRPKRAVKLVGQNIDEIWLVKESELHGRQPNIQFRVLLNRPLTDAAKKAVSAKSKVIKQSKYFGISWGKTADVKWVGGRIVYSLNQDENLRMMLLDPLIGDPFREIKIKKVDASAVTIIIKPEFLPRPFDIKIYDRIAKHIREVVSAY